MVGRLVERAVLAKQQVALEAQFAGYGQGVRTLMLADAFKGRFNGLLADTVEVDEEFEAALEAVLGGRAPPERALARAARLYCREATVRLPLSTRLLMMFEV